MAIQGYIQRGFALTRILTCRDNGKTEVQTGNKTDQVKKEQRMVVDVQQPWRCGGQERHEKR